MHTMPTRNIPEAAELGTPCYEGQNVIEGFHYNTEPLHI